MNPSIDDKIKSGETYSKKELNSLGAEYEFKFGDMEIYRIKNKYFGFKETAEEKYKVIYVFKDISFF